jgi:hypothetical protein
MTTLLCQDWSCSRRAKWMVNGYQGYVPMCGPHKAGDQRSRRAFTRAPDPLRYIAIDDILKWDGTEGNGGPAIDAYNESVRRAEAKRKAEAKQSLRRQQRLKHDAAVAYNADVQRFNSPYTTTRWVNEQGDIVYTAHEAGTDPEDTWDATHIRLVPPKEDPWGRRSLASLHCTGTMTAKDPAQGQAIGMAYMQASLDLLGRWPKGINHTWPEQVDVPPSAKEEA